jgi:hypothetical protein
MMASRILGLALFALIGYGIGFGAFLVLPALGQALVAAWPKVIDQNMVYASISGAVGSIISTMTVSVWSKRATV